MDTVGKYLLVFGVLVFVASIAWLHWRAHRDGYPQGLLLFLTGISAWTYIDRRWNRARHPLAGAIAAAFVAFIGLALSDMRQEMVVVGHVLLVIGAVAFPASIFWLHWRAFRDGYLHDPLLYITGISIWSFIISRWNRASLPLGGQVAAILVVIAAMVLGAASSEPLVLSPEEVAAELKPLVLKEWSRDPELRNMTIQNISLTHHGNRDYSGFIDVTHHGQPQRLALDVVWGKKSVRWEMKPCD